MQTKVQRWGNSLGVRIPRSFAAEVGFEAGSSVDISVEANSVLIRPLGRRYSLRELLKKVTARNLHGEVVTGAPVGRESW
jgi:antitoxin MazE